MASLSLYSEQPVQRRTPWESRVCCPRGENKPSRSAIRSPSCGAKWIRYSTASSRSSASPREESNPSVHASTSRRTDKEVRITAELPGVEEKDVEVSLSGDAITIKGEKREEKEEKGEEQYRLERSYGALSAELLAALRGRRRQSHRLLQEGGPHGDVAEDRGGRQEQEDRGEGCVGGRPPDRVRRDEVGARVRPAAAHAGA